MANDPGHHAFVAQAASACFLLNLAQWGFLPLYPMMARDLGIGADAFSALVALPSIMNALLVVVVGRFVDRFGPAPFLMAGALTLAAGVALRALAGGVALFAIAQFIFGFAWPCFMAALVTAVLRRPGGAKRGEALGWVTFAGGAGQAAGYVAIGYAGAALGWRLTSLVCAAAPLLALPVLRSMRPGLGRLSAHTAGGFRSALRFMRVPRVIALFAISLLAMTVNNGAIYLLPFALLDMGVDSARTGLLIVALILGMLPSAPASSRLAERYGAAPLAGGVLGLSAAGLCALALFGTRIPAVILSFFLMGLVAGVVLTLGQSRFVAFAERSGIVGAGVAVGCARLAQAIGTAFGPAMGGVLYVQVGMESALAALAALELLCVVTALYGYREIKPGEPAGRSPRPR